MKQLLQALFIAGLALSTTMGLAALAADPAPEALIDAGHWKQARAAIEQRYQANPNDAQAAYLLSRVKLAFGDLDNALKLAEKAVELDGIKAAYHYQLGVVCGETAERASLFSKAGWARRFKSEAEKAASLDPHDLDARFGLLEYDLEAPRLMGGGRDKAQAMAAEIAKIDAARGNLAEARLAQQDKDTAAKQESWYLKALTAAPHNYEVLVDLAQFYGPDGRKQFDLAEKYAEQARKLEPGRVDAYAMLAYSDAARGRWPELERDLKAAEKNVPDDLSPYYQAGRALFERGDNPDPAGAPSVLTRAESCFRKYLTQEPEGEAPTLAHAHWRLGLVLEKEGHKPEAIAELETALRLKPDLDAAKKDLKRLNGG
ncbi:MAG TPA: tetratricopeptide repeat protein [Terriglobia bacterium]|nr:tetratricopeptide repeat protein [Terriglobia bacterium]